MKWIFRLLACIFFVIPFVFFDSFYHHFTFHLSGNLLHSVIQNEWPMVIINIVLFCSFLIPLFFRRKINWTEFSLVGAFFISLFIEMYGIPLTVYFAGRFIRTENIASPSTPIVFNFLGVPIGMTIPMIYGSILMIIGTACVIVGWITLYKNLKKETLVTNGIYAYSRHPQYIGFILVIIGWLFGWPTLITLIFAPILIVIYIRVCIIEERELSKNPAYEDYRKLVPFLL